MINVTCNEENGVISLIVKGHSDTMLPGDDPICAAASLMAWTLMQMLIAHKTQGSFKTPPKMFVKSGDAEFICKPKRRDREFVMMSFLFAETGYRILEKNYPDKVKVTQFESR